MYHSHFQSVSSAECWSPLWQAALPVGKECIYIVSRGQTLDGKVRVWSTAHIGLVLTPTPTGVGDKYMRTTAFIVKKLRPHRELPCSRTKMLQSDNGGTIM